MIWLQKRFLTKLSLVGLVSYNMNNGARYMIQKYKAYSILILIALASSCEMNKPHLLNVSSENAQDSTAIDLDVQNTVLRDQSLIQKIKLDTASGTTYPKFYVNEDNVSILAVDENRSAVLYESFTEPFKLKAKFDVIENLCVNEYTKPNCYYNVDISKDNMVLRWIKHSDPTKIGQVVKKKSVGNSDKEFSDILNPVFYGYIDKFMGRDDKRFNADLISCDQFDWLGDTKTSTNWQLGTWSSETMSQNSETNINENMTSTTYENLAWLFDQDGLHLKNLSKITSISIFNKPFPTIPAGQISTLRVLNKSNEYCQISLSHSLGSAVAGIDLDSHYKSNPRFRLYLKPKSMPYQQFKSTITYLLYDYAKTEFE